MKKFSHFYPILLFSFFTAVQINAQTVDVVVHKNGKSQEEKIDIPKSMTYPLDSLLNDWQVKNFIDQQKECSTSPLNPVFADSVYINRLQRIPAVMELPYNEIVRKFIDLYTGHMRNQVSFMLSASNFYIPIFEEALDAYDLPMELKYLPVIESSFNPSAVSRVGAAGLWQFMIYTGKQYGLEINSLVDERRDPIKSTWAAARYLKDLYNIYHDWNLVIAAYNCGPNNINKAIRRCNGKADYWAIYNYLPRETRGYVPAFIAANYVMTYYCNHNICPMETNIPISTDTIQINRNLHFDQISAMLNISKKEIKSLNPQYKRDIIPGESHTYALRLPQSGISHFIDHEDSIYTYHVEELLPNRRIVEAENVSVPTYSRSSSSSSYSRHSRRNSYKKRHSSRKHNKGKSHTIKNGETLSDIAKHYHVTVKQLKRSNHIKGNTIRAGKKIKIHR
jgi:membrane-bound lytic murein transglycosylase D